MDEFFDDDVFCDEPDCQDDAIESGEGVQCQSLAPKYSHHDPDSLYQKDHPAFDALGITPENFMERFSRYEHDRSDYAHALGKFNPYTGEQIINEIAYTQYLREHFFYQLCSLNLERGMSLVATAEQRVSSQAAALQKSQAAIASQEARCKAAQHKLLVERISHEKERQAFCAIRDSLHAEQQELRDELAAKSNELAVKSDELHKLASQRDELHWNLLDAQDKLSPRGRFRRAFPLIFCVAFVTFLLTFYLGKPSWYDSGYQAGKQEVEESAYASGYEDGKRAGAEAGSYSAGYGDGKAIGEEQGYSRGYAAGQRASASSFSSGTGTGSSRQSAIASGYIGNITTGKFHTSSCSYLPNQENQIVFSSYDEAVAAGYSPCGHCL